MSERNRGQRRHRSAASHHNLGLSVVAEGVEHATVMAQLRALDCDEAQGYHMSRPLPAGELPAFARRWASRVGEAASVALH